MNSIIRNMIIAAPLATAALTMVPTSAMASDAPVDIIVKPHTDPQPNIDKIAIPKPEAPGRAQGQDRSPRAQGPGRT